MIDNNWVWSILRFITRYHSEYGPSQWEKTLLSNVVVLISEWSLIPIGQLLVSRFGHIHYEFPTTLLPSHYLNQCWVIIDWTLRNKLQWKCNQFSKLFIDENSSENIVCEMAAIWSTGRWVNLWILSHNRCRLGLLTESEMRASRSATRLPRQKRLRL